MKNETLYRKTVDILLDAYNNGTLTHHNCYACAVGNIVAANMGKKILCYDEGYAHWKLYWEGYTPYPMMNGKGILPLWISGRKDIGEVDYEFIKGEIADQIASTGYSIEEVFEIEKVFERSEWHERGLYGLKNVLLYLGKLHEGEDEVGNTDVKKLEEIHNRKYVKV